MDETPIDRVLRLSVRNLTSPLTSESLAPLDPLCRTVTIRRGLTDAEFQRAGVFLSNYPDVALSVASHGTERPYPTLDFLAHFPTVRRIRINLLHLEDASGLRFLRPDLEVLMLARTEKRFSLDMLERFSGLRDLWLEGHTKDVEVVGKLSALRWLSLRSITLPDLSPFRRLRRLKVLELKLGGTNDLRHLPEIKGLRGGRSDDGTDARPA